MLIVLTFWSHTLKFLLFTSYITLYSFHFPLKNAYRLVTYITERSTGQRMG